MSTLKVEQIQHPDSSTPAISLDSSGNMGDASFANYPGRNRVINGGFDVWQRGTSQSSSGYGSADRWVFNSSGATGTMSQQSFTLGQTEVPGSPRYFARVDITIGNDNAGFQQKIEDVRTFADQTVTLSFWAKADTARTFFGGVNQFFDGSTETSSFSGAVSVTTSWQRFSITGSMGSLIGKTIGNNSCLKININCGPYTGNFTLDLWGVQLELGSVATPFEHRSFGDELARCQRYYQKSYNYSVSPGTASDYSGIVGGGDIFTSSIVTTARRYITLVSSMRTAPTIVTYDTAGASGKVNFPDTSTGKTGISLHVGTSSFGVEGYPSATTGQSRMYFHYTASAEL